MNYFGLLAVALLAAIGNAMFAAGQKKAVGIDNPFTFISLSICVCLFFLISVAPFLGSVNYWASLKQNGVWVVLSGMGLFFAYIGFYFLYSRYGVSSYILYAVMSIITTSVVVGVFIFKEKFNVYHWLAFFTSMATVALFAWGNKVGHA
ncbi:MAG: transporter [Gammaproteobacteria bacterium]